MRLHETKQDSNEDADAGHGDAWEGDPASPQATDSRPNRKHQFEQQSTKPTPLTVTPEGIPARMKARSQWVVWRYEWKAKDDGGKWDKLPYQAKYPEHGASSTNPKTWVSFAEGMAIYLRDGYDGIGYVLNVDEVGIDLDDVRNPVTGTIEPWAVEIVNMVGSYAEISPSGTGVKIIAEGTLTKGRKFAQIGAEMYSRARYLTVTGHVISELSAVEDRQAEVNAVYKILDKHNEAAKKAKGKSSRKIKTLRSTSANLTDDELIAKASAASGDAGKRFREFMQGNINGYSSQSEADLAFCNLIAFWTDDAEQVSRIVQASAMNRSKWNRDDYAERTIKLAFEGRRNRYAPQFRANGQAHHYRNGQDETPAGPPDCGVSDDILDAAPPPDGPPVNDNPPADALDIADPVCLTDVGNAKRFVKDHGVIVRYCHRWKKWIIWDGMRWRIDDIGRPMLLAKKTILGLFLWAESQVKALSTENEDASDEEVKLKSAKLKQIKALLDFALKSQHNSRLEAMLNQAKSELGIPILHTQLDRQPMKFNCINGTLDLTTGELRPHRPEDYLTQLCPLKFDAAAECPVFLETTSSIFRNDTPFIEYVQRFLGYCLTGDTREQSVPIAWGEGSNGKTLLLMEVLKVMGPDYAGVVPPELLMETKNDQHPTIKADLFGKRLMIAAETRQGGRLNEERLKALTGGDPIKARRCREDFWEFDPTHKLFVLTNHKPEIRGNDHGIWRRISLWPFLARYWDGDKGETGPPELKADKLLSEKLKAEHEGILAWLVAGCVKWQKDGMKMPQIVQEATAKYKSAEDQIGAFIAERCQRNGEFRVKISDLYMAFKAWCKMAGEGEISRKAFGTAMGRHGFTKDKGDRWYLGLRLAHQNDEEEV